MVAATAAAPVGAAVPMSCDEAESEELVSVVFTWPFLVSKEALLVLGSWDELPIAMQRTPEGLHQCRIRVRPGVHIYRFIVDGIACYAPTQPLTTSPRGDIRNFVLVPPAAAQQEGLSQAALAEADLQMRRGMRCRKSSSTPELKFLLLDDLAEESGEENEEESDDDGAELAADAEEAAGRCSPEGVPVDGAEEAGEAGEAGEPNGGGATANHHHHHHLGTVLADHDKPRKRGKPRRKLQMGKIVQYRNKQMGEEDDQLMKKARMWAKSERFFTPFDAKVVFPRAPSSSGFSVGGASSGFDSRSTSRSASYVEFPWAGAGHPETPRSVASGTPNNSYPAWYDVNELPFFVRAALASEEGEGPRLYCWNPVRLFYK
eukprot:tig00020660_g12504.t1